MRFLLPNPLKVRDAVLEGTEKGWKRKLTGADQYHFACPGRRHRELHSVHSLISHIYVPCERWHPSVQTTVRAWAPPLQPRLVLPRMFFLVLVMRRFSSAIRD